MKLETKRLIIRKFEYGDEDALFEMCHDEETARFAGWKPHKDVYISYNVVTNYIYGNETFAITLKGMDKVIGTISLYKENARKSTDALELGFCLNKDYRGLGIMSEAVDAMLHYAFEKLNAPIVISCCQVENVRSKNVLEKNHFRYEGLLRSYRRLYNKEIVDVYMYSLKKKEFEEDLENERTKAKI